MSGFAFDGKTAVVTGAGSGMGRATAIMLASRGARVVLGDRDEPGGQATEQRIGDAGGEGRFYRVDISDPASVRAFFDEAFLAYDGVDVACNCAGVEGPDKPLGQTPLAGLREVLAVNVLGTYLCLAQEVEHMVARGGGAIASISSGAGLVAVPGLAAYTTSKHAVVGMTKAGAVEYAAQGVRVNAVAPGPIETPMFDRWAQATPGFADAVKAGVPMHRNGKPDEVAEALVWLCSDAASYVTGAIIPVDGGYVAQ